jgi:hypothetical protein
MKNTIFITTIVFAFVVSPIFASATPTFSVNNLMWLGGCWQSIGAEAGSGEQWTTPAGNTLFGVNRTVRDSNTVAHEFLQIRDVGNNRIEFIALPSGQAGATFVMISQNKTGLYFRVPNTISYNALFIDLNPMGI